LAQFESRDVSMAWIRPADRQRGTSLLHGIAGVPQFVRLIEESDTDDLIHRKRAADAAHIERDGVLGHVGDLPLGQHSLDRKDLVRHNLLFFPLPPFALPLR